MDEYIKKQDALDAIVSAALWGRHYAVPYEEIKEIPSDTAEDFAPIRHGHWSYWPGWMRNHDRSINDATCSECGYRHPRTFRGEPNRHLIHTPDLLPNYCENCGAIMDGGETNDKP